MEFINGGDHNGSELLQAQAHVWNHAFNFINSMSLKCAIQLGIPDIINNHGKPMPLPELIEALNIHPTKACHVHRLMRILVHSGFFSLERGGYLLTPPSHLLFKDNPFRQTPLLLAVLDPVLLDPWHCLSTWFQNDDVSPINTAYKESLWELMAREGRMSDLFNKSMSTDSALIGRLVASQCKEVFEGLNSLVDVGGGTGNMAKAIAEGFPSLECTVLDLPQVISGLKSCEKVKYLEGDMFEAIPPADAILLKWILHDWTDEGCVKILKQCKEAIESKAGNKTGKVIIIDMVLGNQDWDKESVETQLFLDMQMMVVVHGRERTEKEWSKLFFDAGFSNYKIHPIFGLRALIEVYP